MRVVNNKKHSPILIGQNAEVRAKDFLQGNGLKFITNNYKCRYGEIDLIMHDKDSLVFVEVRMRRKSLYGRAAETVDQAKLTKLINAAEFYIQKRYSDKYVPHSRFDLVAIDGDKIEWINNLPIH
ncbi:MAG: YraN family protein [Gammaproteobacteria bacterium]|nr:YraN family protein [Gammaproteobacteria bacterium]